MAQPAAPLPSIALFAPSLDLGGFQQVVLNWAVGFAGAGHAVSLILQEGGGALLPQIPRSVEIIVLGTRRTALTLLPLIRVLRRRRPDVLLSGLPHGNLLAIAASRLGARGVRTIVTEHAPVDDLVRAHPGWRYRVLPRLLALAYPSAGAVVAVSEGVASGLRAILPARTPVSVVYNPVVPPDLDRRMAEPIRDPWLANEDAPLILGVGRLSPEKGFATLIRAFADVVRGRPARLAILGEGPERPALEALVVALGLESSIRLPGYVANPYPLMRGAAVLALASAFEGFGNVLVEAMACGTPVVSTDCPHGPREILENGRFGRLVPLADPPALAAAILETLAAPSDRDALRGRAATFSLDRSIAQMQRLMRGA